MANHSTAFAALADPTRREIFERVAHRPTSVARLHKGLASRISRPAVSQHLKVLKDAGLVVDREDGARRIYRLDTRGVHAMRIYLDKFWDRALAAFKEAAELAEKEGET